MSTLRGSRWSNLLCCIAILWGMLAPVASCLCGGERIASLSELCAAPCPHCAPAREDSPLRPMVRATGHQCRCLSGNTNLFFRTEYSAPAPAFQFLVLPPAPPSLPAIFLTVRRAFAPSGHSPPQASRVVASGPRAPPAL